MRATLAETSTLWQIVREDMAESLPPVGSLVAEKYKLDILLGQGGMGAVYRGRHVEMDKRVALKVLRPEFARDEDVAKRFIREARAAARIQHPNVVEVLDFGVHQGSAYLVMELLEGENLEDLLTRRPLAPLDALALLLDAMRGVAFAHAKGVIHRDIKPANIFVARGPNSMGRWAKILDFGISKVADDASNLTKTGSALGTPEYMSYEHMRNAKEVDARADIYSFGVVLYRALTGVSPFDAESFVEIAVRVATHNPPSLRQHVPGLPPELDRLVMSMIARDRNDRPSNLRELCDEFTRMLASSPIKQQLASMEGPWRKLGHAKADASDEISEDTDIRTFEADRIGLAIVRSSPPPSLDSSGLRTASSPSIPPRSPSARPASPSARPASPSSPGSRASSRASSRPRPSSSAPAPLGLGGSLQPPPALFAGTTEATTNPAAVFLGVSFAVLAVLGAWVLGSSRMPFGPSAASAPKSVSAPSATSIALRSSPAGASVLVNGKLYGPTPMQLVLDHDALEPEAPVSFRFILPGYQEVVVTRAVQGASMVIESPSMRLLSAADKTSP